MAARSIPRAALLLLTQAETITAEFLDEKRIAVVVPTADLAGHLRPRVLLLRVLRVICGFNLSVRIHVGGSSATRFKYSNENSPVECPSPQIGWIA